MILRLFAMLAALLIVPAVKGAEPALDGNCPVCLVEMGKLVAGSAKHTATFDRQVYRFPSAKEKAMFEADPIKFAPVLGGDCVVCKAKMGVRMTGKAEFAAVHNKRAYLFPSAKERGMFQADPKSFESVDVGLAGHCAVCAVNGRKWVLGKPEHVSVYDGMRYLSPSAAEKRAFEADPAKFAPAFDGNCVVCFSEGGQRVAGVPKFSASHGGRIFLFPDDDARKAFLATPAKYADLDLAEAGQCVVCAKMGHKNVPGKAEFASLYKGRRYLFPSAKERSLFDADPKSFATKGTPAGTATSQSSKTDAISVVGTTACAGCEFSVRPLSDSDSLGIAVIAGETVYVVEGGEKRFPKLFQDRFDSLTVELKGSVKKRSGKFVWVEPTSLALRR